MLACTSNASQYPVQLSDVEIGCAARFGFAWFSAKHQIAASCLSSNAGDTFMDITPHQKSDKLTRSHP